MEVTLETVDMHVALGNGVYGWKQVYMDKRDMMAKSECIIKVYVPRDGRNNLGRKVVDAAHAQYKCDRVFVVEGCGRAKFPKGYKSTRTQDIWDLADNRGGVYTAGEWTTCDEYDEALFGIRFYLTRLACIPAHNGISYDYNGGIIKSILCNDQYYGICNHRLPVCMV